MIARVSKFELRRTFRRSRASLPGELADGWSAVISARLASLDVWRDAAVVHCYVGSLPGEVGTDRLIERAYRERKRVICPRVRPHGQLEHRELSDLSQLRETAFGLREPDPSQSPPAAPELANLVVVPGLVFTVAGSRLGMGGGYYDLFLAQHATVRVGLAYEMQLVDSLPVAAHDQSMDWIVTELRVIRCR